MIQILAIMLMLPFGLVIVGMIGLVMKEQGLLGVILFSLGALFFIGVLLLGASLQ